LDVDPCQNYSKTKAINHLFTDELIRLPNPVVGKFASEDDRSLAFRNLLRVYVLTLPSGQRVAYAFLKKGCKFKPVDEKCIYNILIEGCIDKATAKKLSQHTPLFLYVLLEAHCLKNEQKLGPVGSAVLLEVFGNMLVHCKSFLKPFIEKKWRPDPCLEINKKFKLPNIVKYVTK